MGCATDFRAGISAVYYGLWIIGIIAILAYQDTITDEIHDAIKKLDGTEPLSRQSRDLSRELKTPSPESLTLPKLSAVSTPAFNVPLFVQRINESSHIITKRRAGRFRYRPSPVVVIPVIRSRGGGFRPTDNELALAEALRYIIWWLPYGCGFELAKCIGMFLVSLCTLCRAYGCGFFSYIIAFKLSVVNVVALFRFAFIAHPGYVFAALAIWSLVAIFNFLWFASLFEESEDFSFSEE